MCQGLKFRPPPIPLTPAVLTSIRGGNVTMGWTSRVQFGLCSNFFQALCFCYFRREVVCPGS